MQRARHSNHLIMAHRHAAGGAGKFVTMFALGSLVGGSYLMTMRNATKNTITDDDMAEVLSYLALSLQLDDEIHHPPTMY